MSDVPRLHRGIPNNMESFLHDETAREVKLPVDLTCGRCGEMQDPNKPSTICWNCGASLGSESRLQTDSTRIDHLQDLIRECPHTKITFNDDKDTEEGVAGLMGFIIVIEGCRTYQACAPSLRELIDRVVSDHQAPEI